VYSAGRHASASQIQLIEFRGHFPFSDLKGAYMLKTYAISRLAAAAAVFAFALAPAGRANPNILLNGLFSQVGPNNPACLQSFNSAPSAALDWFQFNVIPGSYLCTDVEFFGFLPAIRVLTNGGDSTNPQVAMGSGFGQSFVRPLGCTKSSFLVNVAAGQVTGNLVSAQGPFVEYPVFKPTGGWKLYSQVASDVIGLWFETLSPNGLIPTPPSGGAPVNYLVANAQATSCLNGFPPIIDLSQYFSYDPFYNLKNPGGPVATTRITNTSSVAINGPIHMLLEGVTPRLSVVNPDGDYLGTPFVNLVSGSLAPGQSETITIQFDGDATTPSPSFRVKLASGDF
jgi:hypothetical protein